MHAIHVAYAAFAHLRLTECASPLQELFASIKSLRGAAGKGDLRAAKQQYVATVGSLRQWAAAAGVAGDLKGL